MPKKFKINMPTPKSKKYSAQLNDQTDGYKTIFQNLPVGIVETDFSSLKKLKLIIEKNKVKNIRAYFLKNRRLLSEVIRSIKINHANSAALSLFGAATKKELADNLEKIIHRDSLKLIIGIYTSLLSEQSYFETQLKLRSIQGKMIDVTLHVNVLESHKRVLLTMENITVHKNAERKLTKRCQTDGLTEALNHKEILKRLDQEFKRAVRYKKHFSCLMIDLDHFKKINDLYGHQKGDKILKQTSQKIKRCIREVDIIGRYGGDEFLILLPETSVDNASIVADRLTKLFAELSQGANKNDVFCSLSIGISGVPQENIDSAKKLLAEVDKAMYQVKKAGRNTSSAIKL
ncbi:MAG: GGDEF domain-containing protein [Candidatus Omnitrophica bacterium]|nr:GGDEF domain-containing protein [Candidatus Omnitrophota bacterium]